MLYPISNKCRGIYNLNGLWKMKCIDDKYIPNEPVSDYILMAVPSSINDIVVDREIKEWVGRVLFETEFSFPYDDNKRIFLRLNGTSAKSEIYLNGEYIGETFNGYYPVEIELIDIKEVNRLTVIIDNRLSFQTFPIGLVENNKQIIQHDFYNFTGIHRDVLILTKPKEFIEDIIINTVYNNDYHRIKVDIKGHVENIQYEVLDKDNNVILRSLDNEMYIDNINLWSPNNPYLYRLKVTTKEDLYIQKFGIRKVEVKEKAIYLNAEPIYLKGFGMHEDSFINGKGNSYPVTVRNFELLKWINANSFRTSHYPYDDSWYDLADEKGILIIDEVCAAGMWPWNPSFSEDRINNKTKELHKRLIKELIERDKNHPSVIMLSVANEPETKEEASRPYFIDIVNYAKSLTKLPITIVEVSKFWESKVGDLVDVICINRYYGWYEEHGDLKYIKTMLNKELNMWFDEYHKPIIITEYGADTIEGLHSIPSETFSEEWQLDYIKEHNDLFDTLDFVCGEHIWNFADFKTKEGVKRIRGNRKGVFTKDRQPKLVAHYLKERWKNK